jgi:hypothetical protein
MLWVEDKASDLEIKFRKVWGERNPADLMTKANTWVIMERHLATLQAEFRQGRAESSHEVSRGIDSFALCSRFL